MLKQIINLVMEKKEGWYSRRKSRRILNNTGRISIDLKLVDRYREKWTRLGGRPWKAYLQIYGAVSGIWSEDYVPENIYYGRIEPTLNRKDFALAYADKNFYERYLPENRCLFPIVRLRGINGKVYDPKYRLIEEPSAFLDSLEEGGELILKPASESSGGKNVSLVKVGGGCFNIGGEAFNTSHFIRYLTVRYRNNFVLQDRIAQHPFYARFNPESVNTVRIYTYRSVRDESVHAIQAVLRFGQAGILVDNQAAGGRSIGINSSGMLNAFSVDKWGCVNQEVAARENSDPSPVPGFEQMIDEAKGIAGKYYFHRLLGFDFCYTATKEVKLLEINCKNIEINFLQMNNGPLFGLFTDEVIEYCLHNPKTVILDFHI